MGRWNFFLKRLNLYNRNDLRKSFSYDQQASLPIKPTVVPEVKGNEPSMILPSTPALTDRFNRFHSYLRISLTERCNLRCQYCMPEEGVALQPKSKLLTIDEILYLARIFVELGIRKIRLTGGEPTIRSDITDVIGELKKIHDLKEVNITTNGLMLTRNLVAMQRAGLDGLNISLDTLRSSRFEVITRRKGWSRVLAGIDLAIQLGYKPKINCVLMRNFNEDEIMDFVNFTEDRNCVVRFIEYMPFTGNNWQTDKLISYKEILNIIMAAKPELERLKDGPNDTSKAYRIPGYIGEIGFITSMTENFCSTCNRLRLTADGNLKVCLFGNKEVSLRDAIRSGYTKEELAELISMAVKRKKKQHAENVLIQEQQIRNGINTRTMSGRLRTNWKHVCYYNSIHNNKGRSSLLSSVSSSLHDHQRYFSHKSREVYLTHVDGSGQSHMVDVSLKDHTSREASAQAIVHVGAEIANLIHRNEIKKGDVLALARIAGILAAKRTSELIPLCHNIVLSSVNVKAKLDLHNSNVILVSTVRSFGQTGVEMESLTAVTMAALTVYDMCKAVSHEISIKEVYLLSKTGGKSMDYRREIK